jgi:hypothetical protein
LIRLRGVGVDQRALDLSPQFGESGLEAMGIEITIPFGNICEHGTGEFRVFTSAGKGLAYGLH